MFMVCFEKHFKEYNMHCFQNKGVSDLDYIIVMLSNVL